MKRKILNLIIFIFVFQSHFFAQDQIYLKDIFKDYFMIGAALNRNHFSDEDNSSAAIVKDHFNTVTPENVLKWERVHPEPDEYNLNCLIYL